MTRLPRALRALALTALLARPAVGQDHHGAHRGEKLGTVHFPTSCASAVTPRMTPRHE